MQRTFNRSYDEVYKACLSALKSLEIEIEYKSKNEGIISGETESTLWSWGESISIKIEQSGRSVVVKVNSDSKAQLIDWGKNDRNEEKILTAIANKLR